MTSSFIRYHSRLAICLLIGLRTLSSQAGRAELFGIVRDPKGLAVSGAAAELRDSATGASYATLTGETGGYHFAALPPGEYELTVSKAGFFTVHRTSITLGVAGRVAADFELALGTRADAVEVNAAPPLLRTTDGSLGYTVNGEYTHTLPLDGRNFVALIALVPGVMLPPGQFLPRINGSRPRTSEYLYDGVGVLQPEPGQVAYYPVLDSIAEFHVETNAYSAEYGRSNGGVIQVATRAGTNEWHGTLFEYLRNEALNARNLFAAAAKPLFRRNLFGGVLGGPVRRNRTFFFVDYQGARLATGVTRFSTVPTLAQRQGVFSTAITDPATGAARTPFPNRTIPSDRFDPSALRLLNRYPTPASEASANNFARSGVDTDIADQFDARLDHRWNDHRWNDHRGNDHGGNANRRNAHRFFARYSYFRDEALPMTPLPDGSGNLTTAVNAHTLTRADGVVAEHTWTVSPAAVNQLRFGWTRRAFRVNALDGGASAESLTGILNIPAVSFQGVLPVFEIAGFQQLGPPSSANGRATTAVTEVLDDFALTRGGHSLKLGVDLRFQRLDALQPPNPAGDFQFTAALTGNGFASFLLGAVQNFSLDAQQRTLRPRASIAEGFVQDDWRVNSRLTINLGVRYTLNFPSTEAEGQIGVWNLGTRVLDFPKNARNLEKHNVGPRVGLAYRLSDSFAVRAGYGLVWIEQAGITTPFTAPMFPFIQTLSQSSLDNLTPAFQLSAGPSVKVTTPSATSGLGQGVFAVQREQGSGYAQQWNFTLQKSVRANWSVSLGYAGSKLTNLGVPDTNLNQLPAPLLALRAGLTQPVKNPYYGVIPASSSLGGRTIAQQQLLRRYPEQTTVTLYRNNVGNSTYHALQAQLERRFSRGLTWSVSYTFSKLIDDAGSVFNSALLTGPVANYQAADSFNRRLEKDESTGSIPHVLATGFVWQLPKGWEFSGIVRAQSGMPVTVTQATNFNAAFGFGIQRPNRVGDPALEAGQRSTARYFDTAAFTAAGQFTLGTASRSPARGPGYQAADLMVGKLFRVTERLGAELRAEVFNVSNTPPLGQPNGSFGSAAFGSITTAGDPRVFEFALRVKF
ncbi:MAG: TonB-dependent receptor [Candidatus Solibacter sp.]